MHKKPSDGPPRDRPKPRLRPKFPACPSCLRDGKRLCEHPMLESETKRWFLDRIDRLEGANALKRYNLQMERDTDGDVSGRMVESENGVWCRFEDIGELKLFELMGEKSAKAALAKLHLHAPVDTGRRR